MKIRILTKIVPVLLVCILIFPACNKDKSCTVVITVENDLGIAQPGYMVVFDNHRNAVGANNPDYHTQLVTDSHGKVTATFKLEATIEARAYAPGETVYDIPNEDGWTYVDLEPGETVSYTVVLQ